MHRKALSLIVTSIVATSLLFGEVWESNALSMHLKKLEDVPSSGYYLIDSKEKESLFLDGTLIREKVYFDNGYKILEDGKETIYTLDLAGRPLSITRDDETIRHEYSEEGLLLSSTTTGPDGLETIEIYHWSPEGQLMSVEKVDASYYLPSTRFFYGNGKDTYVLNDETPDVFIEKIDENRTKVLREDDSLKLLLSDGSEKTYSKDGLLTDEIIDGRRYGYFYKEGVLSSTRIVDGDLVTLLIYDDGILLRREYYQDGVKTRVQIFNEDGTMTEERFRNGSPYTKILYDRDHRTIRSIESL